MKYLHISTRVERRIENLRRSGKSSALLADKAGRILAEMAAGKMRHPMDALGSHTRYGEKRIKQCRKFDLGAGYRMITLQRGETVFVPFLGTHDACQRWLQKNSKLKAFNAGSGTVLRIARRVPADSAPESESRPGPIPETPAETADSEPTDRDLREVFSGLVAALRQAGGCQPAAGEDP